MKKLAPAWLMFCAIVLALVVFDHPASAQLVPANPTTSVNGSDISPSSVTTGALDASTGLVANDLQVGQNLRATSPTPSAGNFTCSGGNGYFCLYNPLGWGFASTGGSSFGEYSGGTLVRTVSSNVNVMNVPITAPSSSNTGCRAMDGGSQTIALQTTGMHCFCQDQTTKTNAANCPVSSTTGTISATTSDLICYFCF